MRINKSANENCNHDTYHDKNKNKIKHSSSISVNQSHQFKRPTTVARTAPEWILGAIARKIQPASGLESLSGPAISRPEVRSDKSSSDHHRWANTW